MKRKSARVAIGVAVALVVIALGAWPWQTISQSADGELLWNADETDVFINIDRFGYRLNGFTIVFDALKGYFGVSVPPDDKRLSGLVIRITPKAVDLFRVDYSQVGIMTVFDGHVYRGSTWKWTGSRFESPTPDEQASFAVSSHPYGQFSNADGWSRQCCVFAGPGGRRQLYVKLGAEDVIVRFLATDDDRTIELERSGRPAQQVWSSDQRSYWVGREKYQRFLRFED